MKTTTKIKVPIDVLEYGMKFRIKSSVFYFRGTNEKGLYEACDTYGLTCEFKPNTVVSVFV